MTQLPTAVPSPADDPFLNLTDLRRHLDMDTKTIKKYAVLYGLPLIELSASKKGCFLSQLNEWKTHMAEMREAG